MTRANINIRIDPVSKRPTPPAPCRLARAALLKPKQMTKWYYYYHNGDQYVRGIRDYYGFLKLLRLKNPTKKDIVEYFNKYYGKHFDGTKKTIKLEILHRPCIFYDDGGFLTDYSYVVDFLEDRVLIYNWAELIFQGTIKEAIKWVKEYK